VQERRPVSATPNTRRAKLRSKRQDRPNARLSLRATRARGRLCRQLPLLPHHPQTLGRPPPRPEPAFPSQEPAAPAQHQCPQITARRRRPPAHANLRANSRPGTPCPSDTVVLGKQVARLPLRGHAQLRQREMARICVRPMPAPLTTERPSISS